MHRDGRQSGGGRGLGEGEGSSRFMGTEFLFGKVKKLWRGMVVVMVAQQCEYNRCHRTVPLEMVKRANFMLCTSYHNFFKVSKERKVHGYWSLGKASSRSQSRYHRREAVQSSKWYQPQLTAHHPLPGSGYHASSGRVYALWSLPSPPPSSLQSHSSLPRETEQRGGHWKLY